MNNEVFEYHYGIIDRHELKIPFKHINDIYLEREEEDSNLGCFKLFSILRFMFMNVRTKPHIEYLEHGTGKDHCTLTLQYYSEEENRTIHRNISWPGMSREKAEKIIRKVKARN